ncbi:aldehyde dehydrogenase family protein [Komagataeibacter oboediens]|nr:aldehyde dehydrogenase family protein [Komagataeibacter oboediens]MBL7234113.1 aldehyde dehydrogenase family protein [Komagataeibacter oboediens]WEQ51720.1 aldehyde dehydrogenase family protein [Komagataeibacter oboediens]
MKIHDEKDFAMTASRMEPDLATLLGPDASAILSAPHRNFIDGQWRDSLSGETFPVTDPATGQEIARIPLSGSADVDLAVASARRALQDGPWARMNGAERGRLLWRLADLLAQQTDVFARLEALDTGRPVFETRLVDLPGSIGMLEYMAGWSTKINGESIPVSAPGTFHAYTEREPVGVVAVIVPWNYPLELAIWRMAPALAAGCTVVLKPAEQTALTTLHLGRLIAEAGFPSGVVNIVSGEGETAGAALAGHGDVNAISFTGSTQVGREIIRAAAGNMKRVFLELGGKSPMIVLDDADLEQAVPGIASAIFFSAGQVCTAGSRVFVHERIYDRLLDGIVAFARNLEIGHGLNDATRLGPLVSAEQRDRVAGYLAEAARTGTHFATGGAPVDGPGYFMQPTIAVDVDPQAALYREEIFGPVLCVRRFGDDQIDDVVRMANDTIYGLHASIWTTGLSRAHTLARRIKAGNVCINTHNFFDPAFPMGGFKQSGWGRAAGFPAIEHYTELKGIVARL